MDEVCKECAASVQNVSEKNRRAEDRQSSEEGVWEEAKKEAMSETRGHANRSVSQSKV